MAIVFDSVGKGVDGNTANGTVQTTHTIIGASNTLLMVFAGAAGTISGSRDLVSSPKFAGQSLTKIVAAYEGNNWQSINLWYLINPPVGLGTFNGTWGAGMNDKNVVSIAYTGVTQVTPIIGSVLGTSLSVASSGSIARTITAGNLFVGAFNMSNSPGTTAIGIERGTVVGVDFIELMGADSAGTLRWTYGGADSVMVGAEIAAASAALVTTKPFRTLLGVGV